MSDHGIDNSEGLWFDPFLDAMRMHIWNDLQKLFAVALALALFSHAEAAPIVLDGRVIEIQDGDTLTLMDACRNRHRIRLAGIAAPEIGRGSRKPGQPYGRRSRQSLSDLALGREARAECESKDRYGRMVCTIRVGPLNVNLEQVRLGMAMVHRKYARDQSYYAAEDEAKAARRGLWADEMSPTEPWVWRRQRAAEP